MILDLVEAATAVRTYTLFARERLGLEMFQAGHRPWEGIGTDPYMAPEQCLREERSPATDLYGVGAPLYEMLTGRWPFEGRAMSPGSLSL
jgi:hypothetical protein